MPFIELQSVDSTNNYARSLIDQGKAEHGMGIFAHEQTAGKGQRMKTWIAEPGSSIILSMLLEPGSLVPARQFEISACAAVTAVDFFNKYTMGDAAIKWPNDLYWQDRKAGGILVENLIRGQDWEWSIVGIGININQRQFPSSLPNPVSLLQVTGKEWNTKALAVELYNMFFENFNTLGAGGFPYIYNRYLDLLYKKNRVVKFRAGTRVFEGKVHHVLEDGRLVVKNGMEEIFSTGEIEWM
jgi:BirA family biotin operon repressor/biotin-[acetyl-CoA-carboxylase] ligase